MANDNRPYMQELLVGSLGAVAVSGHAIVERSHSNSACSFGLCCELETCLEAHLTLSGWCCAAELLKEAIVGKLQKGQGMATPPSTHTTCSQRPVPSTHSLLTLKSGMAVE